MANSSYAELLFDYFPDSLRATLDEVQAELVRPPTGLPEYPGLTLIRIEIDPNRSEANRRAHAFYQARGPLRRHLLSVLDRADSALAPLLGNDGLYDQFRRRQFTDAYSAIGNLSYDREFSRMPASFREALTPDRIRFTGTFVFGQPRSALRTWTGTATFDGYRGPALPLDELLLLENFIRGEGEAYFRTHVLRAECKQRMENYGEALREYDELLSEIEDSDMALGGPESRTEIALRAADAYLAWGNALFRRSRELSDADRADIDAKYQAALAQLNQYRVSPDNPRRQMLEDAVRAQREKLEGGFNFLGYHDSYVPFLRRGQLRELATVRVEAAQRAAGKYPEFLRLAIDERLRIQDLQAEVDVAGDLAEIADINRDKANTKAGAIGEQIALIDDQLDSLREQEEVGWFGAAVNYLAEAATYDYVGAFNVVHGQIANDVSNRGRRIELGHQRRIAELERETAQREQQIADRERSIANTKRDAALAGMDVLQSPDGLTADTYYALASTYEDLIRSHLEAAMQWAYLYERAVAFRWLRPNLHPVQFNYLSLNGDGETRAQDVISAADQLNADFIEVQGSDIPRIEMQIGFDENPISLAAMYPLQFAQLVATGRMDFVISLYDLEKRRAGPSQARINRVRVEVKGMDPTAPLGYSGRITHHGTCLLRDKLTTIGDSDLGIPPAPRYMPSVNDLTGALAEIRGGRAQGFAVGGVIPLVLDPDTQELSLAQERRLSNETQEVESTLFSGYGPAAVWSIEIDNENRRSLTDIWLSFDLDFVESSAQLGQKVKELITAYETELAAGDALDRIIPISVKGRSLWPALEDTSQVSLRLGENDVPPRLADLRVKALIAQAIDDEGRGVPEIVLEVAKPDASFTQQWTTGTDGFTEDLSGEVPILTDRFDLLGEWRVRLVHPDQLSRLDDLRLFIMYEYTEVGPA